MLANLKWPQVEGVPEADMPQAFSSMDQAVNECLKEHAPSLRVVNRTHTEGECSAYCAWEKV